MNDRHRKRARTPAPRRGRMERSLLWRVLQVVARFLFTVLMGGRVYGIKHVPGKGGVLLAANHQSYLDPPLLAYRLDRPVSYFSKAELFENPYFGWFIRQLHAFPVRQGEGDAGAVKEAIRRLKEGYVLNIYPEGSRTEDGSIGKIEPGIALVVRRAGVPIVPVVIDGSFQAWPKWRKLFRLRPISVMYGPALKIEDLKPAETVTLLDRTLRGMLAELREKEAARRAWWGLPRLRPPKPPKGWVGEKRVEKKKAVKAEPAKVSA